jgi:mannitol-specific phosphotransferase system IIBC component
MSRYFAMLNSNAYIGIMSFVSIVVSFIFCAYLIESIENN